ncbi:glutaredoxin [Methylobacterium ajmalii]|uniref:glutaredoxin n=1 Tax=Methylobacterium ajmalii TaxID=2738439 RepID=UPI002F35B86F
MVEYRIYGYSGCTWCRKAKELLEEESVAYEWVPIEDADARKAWMDERGFKAPNRTFPRVYGITGDTERLVGGFTELEGDLFLIEP